MTPTGYHNSVFICKNMLTAGVFRADRKSHCERAQIYININIFFLSATNKETDTQMQYYPKTFF